MEQEVELLLGGKKDDILKIIMTKCKHTLECLRNVTDFDFKSLYS